ncbi:MAG: LytTR family DNA-binding domain-containing protein [Bacteroidota bacterium]
MKILIIEDEKHARNHLERMLLDLDPNIQITEKLGSVKKSVEYLQTKPEVDLIFLDIHLSDDLSFQIFEQVEVQIPIIFTTAYDQYAIRAFKVNSIDYLLKPIEAGDLNKALDKYRSYQPQYNMANLSQLVAQLKGEEKKYQERFIVSRGDKILSIPTSEVAYFEGEDRYVFLVTREGNRYIVDYRLSDLEDLLDPQHWYRLNRSFIAQFEVIDKIISLSKSRIKVELLPAARRDIFVSSANTRAFKEWLNR